jgi:hypothetical protein
MDKVLSDRSQRFMVAMAFLLEFYKVVMGSMLTVFVPYRCSSLPDACSITDVLNALATSEDADIKRAAFAMNFATLALVVALYGFEAYREHFCIEYLDIDPDKPNTNLEQEIAAFPRLRERHETLDRRYSKLSGLAALVVAGNFSVSGVFLLRKAAGLSTLVSLVSYLLLLAVKLQRTYAIAHASLREHIAYSAYMTSQRIFNCLDRDHFGNAATSADASEVVVHAE